MAQGLSSGGPQKTLMLGMIGLHLAQLFENDLIRS